jgi:3-methyladenine DNA glycosylase/8-oxoguanine DNA glycosylase
MHRMGMGDPTARLEADRLEKVFHLDGVPLRVVLRREEGALAVEAEGPGADGLLAAWRPHLPPRDGYQAFEPDHPVVRRLHRGHPGLRVVRVPWLFDVACTAILQQRVTLQDARLAWKRIALAHGERGPLGVAWPAPERLAEVPGWELARLGVDPRRARALTTLSREEARRPFLSRSRGSPALPAGEVLRDRLLALRGIGPWTVGMVLGFGAGDPDAVLVGDLHAPHVVAWALAGEPRGSDERMLELLEPFRGQRFRVTRLLLAGPFAPPR